MALPRKRRQKRRTKKRRDWRQIAFYVLSGLVAISMAFGFVLAFLVR